MAVPDPPAADPGSLSILRRVSPERLFNLPLYEHHLVIDLRSAERFAEGRIATAVSFPSPVLDCREAERERGLVAFVRGYARDYLTPENPSPVVVYGDDDSAESAVHAEWLAGRLQRLRAERKTVARLDKEEGEAGGGGGGGGGGGVVVEEADCKLDFFEYFCLTIADRARELWMLEGGYDAFCAEYPFLCGHVEFDDMFPLPHQISRQLLLGTRVFPLTKETLAKLKITHVIVSDFQDVDWEQLEGITVLRCAVKDSNAQVHIIESLVTGARNLLRGRGFHFM